jgi:hypothetical protein
MPCRHLHDENIEALCVPVPAASKNEVCFFSQIFTFSPEKRKFKLKHVRALLSRHLAQHAYGAGRQTDHRALSAYGQIMAQRCDNKA